MKKDQFTLVYENILNNLNSKKIVVESTAAKSDYDKVSSLLETPCFENGPLKVYASDGRRSQRVLERLVEDKDALDDFLQDWDFGDGHVGEARFGFVNGKFVGFSIETYDYAEGCEEFTADLKSVFDENSDKDIYDEEGYPVFPGTEIRNDLAYLCDHVIDFAYDFADSAKKAGDEKRIAALREAAKTSDAAKEALDDLKLD